jgi:hypothetical protein
MLAPSVPFFFVDHCIFLQSLEFSFVLNKYGANLIYLLIIIESLGCVLSPAPQF